MKLLCVLVICILAISSAEEHPRGRMIQVCGADLARAVHRVCVEGDLALFNIQPVQHNDQHDHQHSHHQHELKGQVMERASKPSLVDQCCAKPCHVEDFLSYCPSD